jgi:hypothetical protein
MEWGSEEGCKFGYKTERKRGEKLNRGMKVTRK